MSYRIPRTLTPIQSYFVNDRYFDLIAIRVNRNKRFGFNKIGILWPRSKFIGCRSEAEGSDYPEMLRIIDDSWCPTPFLAYRGGSQYISRTRIVGITKDSAGNPLGNCIVQLIRVSTNELVDTFLSDAGGNYQAWTPYPGEYHYCIAFKALAPDVAGITVKTLVGQTYP